MGKYENALMNMDVFRGSVGGIVGILEVVGAV